MHMMRCFHACRGRLESKLFADAPYGGGWVISYETGSIGSRKRIQKLFMIDFSKCVQAITGAFTVGSVGWVHEKCRTTVLLTVSNDAHAVTFEESDPVSEFVYSRNASH